MRTKFKEQMGNEVVFFTPELIPVTYNGLRGRFWTVEKTTMGSGVIYRCDNFFAEKRTTRAKLIEFYIDRVLDSADEANLNAAEQMCW